MQGVQDVLAYENAYLDMIKARLKRLQLLSEGNHSLDLVYGQIKDAYLLAVEAMHALQADIESTRNDTLVQAHTQEIEAQIPILQQRRRLTAAVMGLGRCLRDQSRLPSEVFRTEMQRVGQEIIAQFERLVVNPEVDTQQLGEYIDRVSGLICKFPLPDAAALRGEKGTSWFVEILKGLAWSTAGWMVNDVWHGRSALLRRNKTQEGQLAA